MAHGNSFKFRSKTELGHFHKTHGNPKRRHKWKGFNLATKQIYEKQLKIENSFYKEALLSISKFVTTKGIPTLQHWDQEHIFYNPLFTQENGETLSITNYFEDKNYFTFEQLLEEKAKEARKIQFDKKLTDLSHKIKLNTSVRKEDILVTNKGDEIKFTQITQKQLYEEALNKIYRDHHSQHKWVCKFSNSIIWEDVWSAVHNFLPSNETKTAIWQQLHLNYYTQYSYNRWHKTNDLCPLCHTSPEDIYHIIIDCDFTKKLWNEIEPMLNKLHQAPISIEEKAFGVIEKNKTKGVILRNWLTYFLREQIMIEEKQAYHSQKTPNIETFKRKFNQKFHTELQMKYYRFENENNLDLFDELITYASVLGTNTEHEGYKVAQIFN